MAKPPSNAAIINRGNQLNPTHPAYYKSRGATHAQALEMAAHSKPVLDDRSVKLNPNNDKYYSSRGIDASVKNSPDNSLGNPK
jgi:hypothetical protein